MAHQAKNIIKRIGILILALILITGGAIFIFRSRIVAHFIPEIEQTGDIHIDIKNDTSYISSKLTVRNRSFLKIKVDTFTYTVSLFNKTYLKSHKFIGMVLHGYRTDTINFLLKIPYAAILKDLSTQRIKGDSASYSINISLLYSTVFGKAEIPFNKSAKLKLPQPPELELVEIKYTKFRLRSIVADAKIKITNYSPVTLSIKEMKYAMNVLKEGNLQGNFSQPTTIKPRGITYVDIPIEINVINMGKTIFEVIMNRDTYTYTLTLDATLETAGTLKRSFHIALSKTGIMEFKK
jgi:LEA14-like dessication related protein